MAKFNVGTVRPGDGQAVVDTPVEDLRQQAPVQEEVQAEGSLDDLLLENPFDEAPAPQPTAPEVAEGALPQGQMDQIYNEQVELEEERQREAVTPLTKRRNEKRADVWSSKKGPDITSDGGMGKRANRVAKLINTPQALSGTETGKGKIGEILVETRAFNPETGVDPMFGQTVSVVTENFMAELAAGGDPYNPTGLTPEGEVEEVNPQTSVSKAQGSAHLGQQIHREYQRLKNDQEGRPTDDYQEISPEQATILGDAAKEIYYEANRDDNGRPMLRREIAEDGQVHFSMTSELLAQYDQGKAYRKRLFPKQRVRPTKTVMPRGELIGEGRQAVKGLTGKVGKTPVNERRVAEAAANMHTVPNVVDKQRLRILYATILPALMHRPENYGADPILDAFAEINNFGPSKVNKFKAQQQIKESKGELDYNWQEEVRNLKKSIAQSVMGIAQERNGANHLTYDIQAFNGRLSPQQTHFDPTTSKAVRFVTRNATPVTVKPGSRQERNLIQMYALILGEKGTDALLPEGRVEAMKRQTPQLEAWGRRMNEILNNTIDDATAEQISAAIEQGMPLNDPNFPQIPTLGLDPEADADLLAAIRGKGEDGPAFIDGLIDFAKYQAAKKRGAPHYTYFNAYIDGKTNGIASNGMQMGDEQVALRTGVTRSETSSYAVDDDIDIRDQLKEILLEAAENGFDGHYEADMLPFVHTLAKSAFGTRDLNKKTTMTFGYGKEIDSFKKDIEDTLYENAVSDPDVQAAITALEQNGDENLMPTVIDSLMMKYAEGLEQVMSEKGIESRHMMWGVAAVNAMADTIMTIKTYTGMDLRFGGNEADAGLTENLGTYKVGGKERRVYKYGTRPTSAAVRKRTDNDGQVTEDVGGWAWGGAVPGPVQSLDAATVALTATGRSWDRLRKGSNGNPYMHQIYDAFKMDANGYDIMLEEVNRNWMDATMKWSYLEQARDSLRTAEMEWDDNLRHLDHREILPMEQFPFIQFLFNEGGDGGNWPSNLKRKLKSLAPYHKGMSSADRNAWAIETTKEILKQTGIKPGAKEVSVEQLHKFKSLFMGTTRIRSRLDSLIEQTNKDKKALRARIGKEKIYQYYTH